MISFREKKEKKTIKLERDFKRKMYRNVSDFSTNEISASENTPC